MKTSYPKQAWATAVLAASLSFSSCQPDGFSASVTALSKQAASEVESAQLSLHVSALVNSRQMETAISSPLWGGMPLRRKNAASYMDSYFRGIGLAVQHEREVQNEIETENLYVDLPGHDRKEELVLVTGHYDNWHLGADDNASAVAVLLETARILRSRNLSRTVRIIAFDREEEGLIGSDRYARAHVGEKIVGILNMDCVGFASRALNSQTAPPGLALRSVGDFLAIIASDASADMLSKVTKLSTELPLPNPVLGIVAPGDGHNAAGSAFLRSDHAPFWQKGIPALFLTDTANYRNPNYHRPGDLPDTLDYEFLSRNAALVVASAVALAEEGSR